LLREVKVEAALFLMFFCDKPFAGMTEKFNDEVRGDGKADDDSDVFPLRGSSKSGDEFIDRFGTNLSMGTRRNHHRLCRRRAPRR